MKVLVIGAAIVDVIIKLPILPKKGEDVACQETFSMVGGCAYNVANLLRNLEVDHDLFVPVGTGMYANVIEDQLASDGYDVMIKDSSEDNGYCLCLVEADGERTFITIQGLEAKFKDLWFKKVAKKNYEIIYVAGYQCLSESGKVISKWLVEQRNSTLFFAPGPVITSLETNTLKTIYRCQPIIHLNEKEALDYTKKSNIKEALKSIYNLSKNIVIATLGERGAVYFDGYEYQFIVGKKVDMIDTIGAGDSHIASIIAMYSKGYSMTESIKTANRVAANVVGVQGAKLNKEILGEIYNG